MSTGDLDARAKRGDLELERLRARLAEARGTPRERELDHELRTLARNELSWRVEARPDDLDLRLRLGEALFALEEWSASVAHFQRAKSHVLRRGEACFRLGLTFKMMRIPTLALKELNEARAAFARQPDGPLTQEVERLIAEIYRSFRGPDEGPGSLAPLRAGDPPRPPRPEGEEQRRGGTT